MMYALLKAIQINIFIYKVTIDIIINNICNNRSLPILQINPSILHKLLMICTTKVPFYNHNAEIYT